MMLNYINIEDQSGQCLRIRFADTKMVGYCSFDKKKYAEPPIDEGQEKDLWRHVIGTMKQVYGEQIDLTPEFQAELAKQFDAGIVLLEFDTESGELTLKENQPCQPSTEANISIRRNSSKPPTSKKAKPKSPSKSLKR